MATVTFDPRRAGPSVRVEACVKPEAFLITAFLRNLVHKRGTTGEETRLCESSEWSSSGCVQVSEWPSSLPVCRLTAGHQTNRYEFRWSSSDCGTEQAEGHMRLMEGWRRRNRLIKECFYRQERCDRTSGASLSSNPGLFLTSLVKRAAQPNPQCWTLNHTWAKRFPLRRFTGLEKGGNRDFGPSLIIRPVVFSVRASYLRMQSRACVKTCGAMPCSCCRIRHCSRVTDIAVRSLALLQLVKRTPFSRRHTWGAERERRAVTVTAKYYFLSQLICVASGRPRVLESYQRIEWSHVRLS